MACLTIVLYVIAAADTWFIGANLPSDEFSGRGILAFFDKDLELDEEDRNKVKPGRTLDAIYQGEFS